MQEKTRKMVLTALFISIGVVLPQVFHLLPWGGSVLLPMHIPVLLCGMIVGGPYGMICGVVTVALSILITAMPPFYPIGVCMMAELAAYGLICGLLYERTDRISLSLVGAMLGGRVINGVCMASTLGLSGKAYTLQAFISGAFLTAFPGIVLQLVVIPIIVLSLKRAKLIGVGRR